MRKAQARGMLHSFAWEASARKADYLILLAGECTPVIYSGRYFFAHPSIAFSLFQDFCPQRGPLPGRPACDPVGN